jgi:ComF family protein
MLAEALRPLCDEWRPDLLVPVPLHPRRLRQRSYNQALLLARELGRNLSLPVASRLLQRRHPTPPQRGLSARVRFHNLRGAFALERPLAGERILLVDDVMTTGATTSECTRTLLAGGGGEVAVAVLGRARRHH